MGHGNAEDGTWCPGNLKLDILGHVYVTVSDQIRSTVWAGQFIKLPVYGTVRCVMLVYDGYLLGVGGRSLDGCQDMLYLI